MEHKQETVDEMFARLDKEFEETDKFMQEAEQMVEAWKKAHPKEAQEIEERHNEIEEGRRRYNEMIQNGTPWEVAYGYLMEVRNSVNAKSKFPGSFDYMFLYPDLITASVL